MRHGGILSTRKNMAHRLQIFITIICGLPGTNFVTSRSPRPRIPVSGCYFTVRRAMGLPAAMLDHRHNVEGALTAGHCATPAGPIPLDMLLMWLYRSKKNMNMLTPPYYTLLWAVLQCFSAFHLQVAYSPKSVKSRTRACVRI